LHFKTESSFDQGEPLLESDEQNEFNVLRRKQLAGDLSDEERERYRQLEAKETKARKNRYHP